MSHLLDRITFFNKTKPEDFSNGHGKLVHENRDWEMAYRNRWGMIKLFVQRMVLTAQVSCSWKIYVKNGLVTWETQQTNYPRTCPDLPDHELRGCQRGATYSWYLYSSTRLKYPLIRSRLLKI